MERQTIDGLRLVCERVASAGEWVTPVLEAVREIDAELAAWRPAPDERSIAEIVKHTVAWLDWATVWLGGHDRDVTDWPEPDGEEWDRLRQRLQESLAAFERQVAATAPDDLHRAPTPDVTATTRFVGIQSILVHTAYHAGQIVKLAERGRSEAGATPG